MRAVAEFHTRAEKALEERERGLCLSPNLTPPKA